MNNATEAQVTFHNIGCNNVAAAAGSRRPLYLQVQLYTSMLDMSSGAHLEVLVSGGGPSAAQSISLQCVLQSLVCSAEPTTCLSDVDIAYLVGDDHGGSLYITMKMKDEEVMGAYNPCIYRGIKNVRYIMSARLTSKPISIFNSSSSRPSISSNQGLTSKLLFISSIHICLRFML